MALIGPLGAVQFLVFTNWHLFHVQQELNSRVSIDDEAALRALFQPMAADVGYHSLKPRHEGQEPMDTSCEYLGGRPCYYDGSGLRAVELFNDVLLPRGGDGVWEFLREYYRDVFES